METSVLLRHGPTGISTRATKSRNAEQNRKEALRLLRLALAVEVRTERPESSVPSALWRSRRRGGRIAVNARHADLPPLIAEALDVLSAHAWTGPEAAAVLGVTPTQLVKMLAKHPPALVRWNGERAARGLRPLRD